MHVVLLLAHAGSFKPVCNGFDDSDRESSFSDNEFVSSEANPPNVSMPHELISMNQLRKTIA